MSDPRDPRDPPSEFDVAAAAEQARVRLRREFEELREDLFTEPKPVAEPGKPAAEAGRERSRILGRSGSAALASLGVAAAMALGVVTGQLARNGSAPISGSLVP
ncbi:MAG TPA: hypothetical protein VFZ41_08685, partial [Solirubrobacterales bacterium]